MAQLRAWKELYRPQSEPAIDIVFLHAIASDYRRTWSELGLQAVSAPIAHDVASAPGSKTKKTSSGNGQQIWIEDSMKKSFPAARIVTWGCHAFEPTKFDSGMFDRSRDYLLRALDEFRDQVDRPVIFVAHSIAGSILKAAFVHGCQSNATWCKVTRSMIFLATPCFDDKQSWSSFLHTLYRQPKKRDLPWNKLRFRCLVNLNPLFEGACAQSSSLRLICVYEELSVYGRGILVPQRFAVVNGSQAIAACADHFSISRINPYQDEYYKEIMTAIKDALMMKDTASGELEQTQLAAIPIRILDAEEQVEEPESLPQDELESVLPEKIRAIFQKKEPLWKDDGFTDVLALIKHRPRLSKMFKVAHRLHENGYYFEAEEAYTKTLSALRTSAPTEVIFFCRDQRCTVMYALAKYDEVEDECKCLMKEKSDAPFKDIRSLMRTSRNLAMAMRVRGAYKEAFSCLIDILEPAKDFAWASYDHLLTMDLVARLMKDQQEYLTAEFLSREVVEASSYRFGFTNRFTLDRISYMASLLWLRNHRRRAEETAWFAYKNLCAELGSDHPTALAAGRTCANFLRYQRHYSEASQMLCDMLPLTKSKLGENHPATWRVRISLASIQILHGQIGTGGYTLQRAAKQKGTKSRYIEWIKQVLHLLEPYRREGLHIVSTSTAEEVLSGQKSQRVLTRPIKIIGQSFLNSSKQGFNTDVSEDSDAIDGQLESSIALRSVTRSRLKVSRNDESVNLARSINSPPEHEEEALIEYDDEPNPANLPPQLTELLTQPPRPFVNRSVVFKSWHSVPRPRNIEGQSSILLHALEGRLDDVRTALNKDEDLIYTISGWEGSILHVAAASGNLALMKMLLSWRAGIEYLLLMQIGRFVSPIKAAMMYNHAEMVRLLLSRMKQAKIPKEIEIPAVTTLEVAILLEKEQLVSINLEQNSDRNNPNHESPFFGNSLCQAAPTGMPGIVEKLINAGARADSYGSISFLAVEEAGLAAGDATIISEEKQTDYLEQLESSPDQKLEQSLLVVDALVEPTVKALEQRIAEFDVLPIENTQVHPIVEGVDEDIAGEVRDQVNELIQQPRKILRLSLKDHPFSNLFRSVDMPAFHRSNRQSTLPIPRSSTLDSFTSPGPRRISSLPPRLGKEPSHFEVVRLRGHTTTSKEAPEPFPQRPPL